MNYKTISLLIGIFVCFSTAYSQTELNDNLNKSSVIARKDNNSCNADKLTLEKTQPVNKLYANKIVKEKLFPVIRIETDGQTIPVECTQDTSIYYDMERFNQESRLKFIPQNQQKNETRHISLIHLNGE